MKGEEKREKHEQVITKRKVRERIRSFVALPISHLGSKNNNTILLGGFLTTVVYGKVLTTLNDKSNHITEQMQGTLSECECKSRLAAYLSGGKLHSKTSQTLDSHGGLKKQHNEL